MELADDDAKLRALPAAWTFDSIGNLFDIRQGKSLARHKQTGKQKNKFLRTANVLWGKLDLSQVDEMDFSPAECETLALKSGDLLVCEGGDIGRTAVWRDELADCYYQNHLHRLRVRDGRVNPEFVMFWMQAAITQLRVYEGFGNKTTIPNLSRSRLSDFVIPVPEKSEQEKIAAVLWKIQKAIEIEDAIVRNARDLKKSLLRHLFTHGLRGEPLKETEIGPLPQSWDVELLSDCAHVQTGVAKGRRIDEPDLIEVPYLRVANVQHGHLDLTEVKKIQIRRDELSRYSLRKDDIVVTEGGDFDKLGRGFIWDGQVDPCVHQNHIFVIRPNRNRLLPRYLAYLIQSPHGRDYFLTVAHKTTNLACINTSKLKALPLLIPPLIDQKEIADILQTVDRKIDIHEAKKRSLQELFKTMLNKLMTAQIRVNDLDIDTSEVTK
ncbi:MAG TPA: restriction endonuclease subunit S [Candidatus Udaeobacter sp.]|nr:restriction endonuclease subunit S [Candidatus Udaeobacter sp.]